MKLKAKDTLNVSSVKADNIIPGEVFDVSDDIGRQLVERGLATAAGSSDAPRAAAPAVEVEAKAAPEHLNKMNFAPENKRKGK